MEALGFIMDTDTARQAICYSRALVYAKTEGYQAGREGMFLGQNPYHGMGEISDAWEAGWGDGRKADCAAG